MSDKLRTMPPSALRTRQELARYVVRMLRTEWKDEEGAAAALATYEGQLRAITGEIGRRRRLEREKGGEPKPPARRARMRAATLGADHG